MTEKEIAITFLQCAVTNEVNDVYDKYIAEGFIHHNPHYKSDKNSLLEGMVESNRVHPNKKITIKNVVAELPYVVVFSHVLVTEGVEAALVHTFKFENGKVVELWDIAQPVPNDMVNEKGMF